MDDKNKFEIKLGEQPKKFIDDILDRKDKKAFYKITDTIKKLQEDPLSISVPIINHYDEDLLQRLWSYKGKIINKLSHRKESPFGLDKPDKLDLGVLNVGIEDTLISCYEASIFYNAKKISVKSFAEELKRGVYFNSAVFRNDAYEIRLSDNPPSKEFLIRSDAISIDNNIRKK